MIRRLTRDELQWLRLVAQHLVTPGFGDVAACVAGMGALQAQEKTSSFLALRPRTYDITAHDVRAALDKERSIVRTWCLRGTLHLVARNDVRWLLPLVARRVLAGRRGRYRQLGLDEETMEAAVDLIAAALGEGTPLTRVELGDYLERNGIRAEGQRLPHLLGRAALLSLVCFGPDRDGAETYVLLDRWLGADKKQRERGWEVLAARYVQSYGPVTPTDFAKWSGAPIGQVRTAFAALGDILEEVVYEGEPLWLPKTQLSSLREREGIDTPVVRLLAAYDPLLLGYRSRDWLVEAAFAREIHPGGGLIRPTITIDGAAAGTWRLARRGSRFNLMVKPFVALSPSSEEALAAEAEEVGRFLGQALTLDVE